MTSTHPEIRWAQRSSEHDAAKNIVFFSVMVSDLEPNYKLEVTPTQVIFNGKSTLDKSKTYEFTLDLFAEVEPEEGKKVAVQGKCLVVTLRKKELKEEYWPRLTKDKKVQFVKTDFDKWRDEDEQEGDVPDLGDDMSGMPGGMDMASMMGGAGGGMGGMGGMDMQKLMAQMGSMGGAGGAGGSDDIPDAGGDDTSDDDDMPALEEATSSTDKGKGKAVDP